MKKIIMSLAAVALALSASAAPISPEQALQRLAANSPIRVKAASDIKLACSVKAVSGNVAAYIFTPLQGGGFTILSADDVAVPVLGYSDTGSIDVDNLPPSLVWWLDECARKAEYAASIGAEASLMKPYAPADMTPIQPMIKTKWDQDAPYNNMAPSIGGVRTYTGCVATSLAQVMNYFKYPERGQGSVRYTDSSGNLRTMRFNQKAFDWDNMLDEYVSGEYDDAQANAVAYLMKSCGFGVQMHYGTNASGAQSYRIMNAAVNYFMYDQGICYYDRNCFPTDQWIRMVYDNLKNVGPVIYDGTSMEGGHSFVCDGYDGNGYFHFNWGWGGMSDGYYVLDNLNPESQGIGGAEGGFNHGQSAVFNMRKPVEGSQPTPAMMRIFGNATPTLSGNEISFSATGDFTTLGWGNGSFTDFTVNVGAIITPVGSDTPVAYVTGVMARPGASSTNVISLSPGQYIRGENIMPTITIPSNLSNGDYKVTLATRDVNVENAPWIPMLFNWGCHNYCYLKINGSNKSVTAVADCNLTFEDCVIDSPLYLGRNVKLVSTVKNTTDEELTLCYTPVLYRDGAIQYTGDWMLVTADAGAEIEKISRVAFNPVQGATSTGYGTYTLKIVDVDKNKVIATFGDYEMTSTSGTLKVTLDDLSIQNAPQESVTKGSRTFKDVYMVPDASRFFVHFVYTVKQGYLDTSVKLVLGEYNETANRFVADEGDIYYDNPFLGFGNSKDITVAMNLSDRSKTALYQLRASYMFGGQQKSLGSIYFAFDSSGVELIGVDGTSDVEYYNLQGVRIAAPEPGQLVICKAAGRTFKVKF